MISLLGYRDAIPPFRTSSGTKTTPLAHKASDAPGARFAEGSEKRTQRHHPRSRH